MASTSTAVPPSGNSMAKEVGGAPAQPAKGDPVSALMAKAKALKKRDDAQKARKVQGALPKGDEKEMSVVERRNMEKTRQFRWAWAWSLGFFGWLL